MLLLAYLPEIAAFLLTVISTTQRFEIGALLVAAQLGIAGLLFIARPRAFVETALKWWPLLLVPILAPLSALWSEAPAATLRYGAQLLFSAFVGVHLARLMTPARFVTVFLLAMFVFCVLCVVDGRQGHSAEGMVLIGLTGSKNQLGFAAQFLLLAALAALMLARVSIALRWIALLSIPLAFYLLWGSHSATALLMSVFGALLLLALGAAQRLPPGGRFAVIVGALLVLSPLTALLPEANEFVNRFVFDTLNKDPTLTGRTILWARADELIAQRPILGWGYQAIWMGDSFETIGLKRLTGMSDGRVFHFHHQFRQIGVDLGFVGLIGFVGGVIATFLAGLRQVLLAPHPATSFFFVLFILMLARAFTDTVLSPFSVHTIVFFASSVFLFWKPAAAPHEAHARAAQVWPFSRGVWMTR